MYIKIRRERKYIQFVVSNNVKCIKIIYIKVSQTGVCEGTAGVLEFNEKLIIYWIIIIIYVCLLCAYREINSVTW